MIIITKHGKIWFRLINDVLFKYRSFLISKSFVMYVTQDLETQIESLKKAKKRDKALKILNSILAKNPHNEYALLQIADIKYQQGLIQEAQKPVDFLIKTINRNDPMVWYVKGVIEMEKANWDEAIKYLKKAIYITGETNPELLRAYWLSLYRGGHRERWWQTLEKAHHLNPLDAEILYNMVQLCILENRCKKAQKLVDYYFANMHRIQTFDKDKSFYDKKFEMFKDYIQSKCL